MIFFRYHKPSVALRSFVRSYYAIEADVPPGFVLNDLLVPELANVRIILKGSISLSFPDGKTTQVPETSLLLGPTSRAIRLTSIGPLRVFGIGLLPAGLASLVGIPADLLADGQHLLADLVGPARDRALRETVREASSSQAMAEAADRALIDWRRDRRHMERLRTIDRLVRGNDPLSVDGLASAVGVSARQLERQCFNHFGFAPKLLLRRERFIRAMDTLRRNEQAKWLDAAGPDFYDQSHFIREFRYFTGVTPGTYLASRRLLTQGAFDALTELGASIRPERPNATRIIGQNQIETASGT